MILLRQKTKEFSKTVTKEANRMIRRKFKYVRPGQVEKAKVQEILRKDGGTGKEWEKYFELQRKEASGSSGDALMTRISRKGAIPNTELSASEQRRAIMRARNN